MRLRLTTFGITIAALVIAPSARAQVTLRTTGYEARDALTDFVHIWVSPFRAERRDWIAAMGVAAGAIALVPIDDQIDEWIVNHPNSAFHVVTKPWDESNPALGDLSTGRRLLPISGRSSRQEWWRTTGNFEKRDGGASPPGRRAAASGA